MMNFKKVKLFLLALLSFPLVALSQQEKSILFSNDTNFTDVLRKARAEHKLIFIDCYASWCAPCKAMEYEVYTNQKVVSYFNEHFINLKLQIDQTNADVPEVISQRKLAKSIWDNNHLKAYPSLLFYDSQGQFQFKEEGYQDTSQLLKEARSIVDNKYNTEKTKYLSGDHGNSTVFYLMSEALLRKDQTLAENLHNDFVANIDNPFTIDNLNIIIATLKHTSQKGYALLINNPAKIDTIYHTPGYAQNIAKVILKNELAKDPRLKGTPDWEKIYRLMIGIDPDADRKDLAYLKVMVAANNRDWELWGERLLDYYDSYAKTFDHNERFLINNYLWFLFNQCKNQNTLARAAKRSYQTLKDGTTDTNKANPENIDTYANLLYKSGDRTKAMKWERRAIDLDRTNNIEFRGHLIAMTNNQPTWKTN